MIISQVLIKLMPPLISTFGELTRRCACHPRSRRQKKWDLEPELGGGAGIRGSNMESWNVLGSNPNAGSYSSSRGTTIAILSEQLIRSRRSLVPPHCAG